MPAPSGCEKDLEDQPAIQATMMRTMGRVYTELSLFDAAEPLVQQAVRAGRGRSLRWTISNWRRDCTNWPSSTPGPTALDEAEELARRSLAIREERLGPDHLRVAQSLNAAGQRPAEPGSPGRSRRRP